MMEFPNIEPETIRILNTVFAGVEGDKISRQDVLDRISLKTYYNYGPTLYKAGLAEPIKAGRKFTHIKLTKLGKQVRASGNVKPAGNGSATNVVSLLEEITKLADEFNRQTPSWEWKLMRKEVANRQ